MYWVKVDSQKSCVNVVTGLSIQLWHQPRMPNNDKTIQSQNLRLPSHIPSLTPETLGPSGRLGSHQTLGTYLVFHPRFLKICQRKTHLKVWNLQIYIPLTAMYCTAYSFCVLTSPVCAISSAPIPPSTTHLQAADD